MLFVYINTTHRLCRGWPTSKTYAQSKIFGSKSYSHNKAFTNRNQCTNTQCTKLNHHSFFFVKSNQHSFTKKEANKLLINKNMTLQSPWLRATGALDLTQTKCAILNYKPGDWFYTYAHGAGTPTYHSSKSSKNTSDFFFNGEPAIKFMKYYYTKCNTTIYFS